jgi:hypothetical protein
MDPKPVILYLLKKYGPLTLRRIRYVMYLIDRELHNRYGYTLFRWKVYKYGIISRELYDALDDLWTDDKIERKVGDYDIVYECVGGCDVNIPPEVGEVVDYVIGIVNNMSDGELIRYVYRLDGIDYRIPGEILIG